MEVAECTAARKLFVFTDMPLISMANAGSTFVAQNRGASQPERVRKGMPEDLKEKIENKLQEIEGNYQFMIHVDQSYVPV